MNILFINQAFSPDSSASSQYLGDLVQSFLTGEHKEKQHKVTVLTGSQGYLDKNQYYPKSEIIGNLKIIRVNSWKVPGIHKISRITNAILLNLAFAMRLFFMQRQDIVVAMTSPPLVAWIAVCFAKKPTRGFVYWVLDLNPDQAIELGWIKKDSLLAGLLQTCLSYVIKKSLLVIVLDKYMRERLLRRGFDASKIKVFPLWSNCSELQIVEKEDNQFIKDHQLIDKFIVMYSGNLSICHPIDTIIQAAQALQQYPDIVFIFIGEGGRRKELDDAICANNLKNVISLSYQEKSQLAHSLGAADLHLISMGEQFSGILHPSKIYGIMAIAKPFIFIGPEESFINDLIVENQSGLRVTHGDIQEFIKYVLQVRACNKNQRLSNSQRLREEALKFDKDKITNDITSYLLNDLTAVSH